MSEFINEHPSVLDDSQLPRRKDDSEDLLGLHVSKDALEKKKKLLKLCSVDSPVIHEIELLDKLLSSTTLDNEPVPGLIDDRVSHDSSRTGDSDSEGEYEEEDPLDPQEVYDLIAHISDPEHPLTLGQLAVVNLQDIEVHDESKTNIAEIVVRLTPTITHCSLATLIGLGIRVRLERSLTPRYRVTILLKEGSHQSENQVNKQLNDKERVAAACENEQLVEVVSKMLSTCK